MTLAFTLLMGAVIAGLILWGFRLAGTIERGLTRPDEEEDRD